jgi:carotenoid cleavage dioxygenase-like enzyme
MVPETHPGATGRINDMGRSEGPWHPVVAEALIERRRLLQVALAAAAAGSLTACARSGETSAPHSAGPTAAARPSTTIPSPASTTPGTTTTNTATTVTTTTAVQYDPDLPYWIQGNFAPVDDEIEAVALTVDGALPPELDGLYVRNGSNPASGSSAHWFLGDGMVHGVRLRDGRAEWYRNRWVRTPLLGKGDILGGGATGAPGGANNSSNTSAFHHAGRLLSLQEVGFPYQLSPDDLSTVGAWDMGGALTTAMTAHPKIDPATGLLHFFGYGFVPPYLTYHVADVDGTLLSSEPVDVAGPTMIHDFAITERDVVFWELPVVFSLDLALAGEMPFEWRPDYGARVGTFPLGGPADAIRWVEIEPCYVFHGTNAWRDGDAVVLDVSRMPTMFAPGGDAGPNALHRWRLDTSGTALTFSDEVLADRSLDLPTVDHRVLGRPHRHAWYATTRDTLGGFDFGGVVHYDARTGRTDAWNPGQHESAGEALFVPAGPSAAEGEGWVLTFGYDAARHGSDLLVFDATNCSAGPVARVRLPRRVPYGFHGCWVPGPTA